VNPADATCSPVEILRMLADRLSGSLLTGQEVHGIRRAADGGVEIAAGDALIHAQHVLVAMNAYAPRLLPSLAPFIAPNRGQMLAMAPHSARLDYAYYANHGSE
jgi:glycine/D-amino acid oxidase-like deaminating enzyme